MSQLTLHEAMKVVLSEMAKFEASTSEISKVIEDRSLYIRRDGRFAKQAKSGQEREDIPDYSKYTTG
jgi:hypothetical protein